MAFQLVSLSSLLAGPMRPGRVVWIGLRPERRAPVEPVAEAVLDPLDGLLGDHYGNRTTRPRQVTLIGQEALQAIASYLELARIDPALIRRNIVTAGINLHALKSHDIRIGSATLRVTGECHPCSRMEEIFGRGGYNAVRGHGGLTARIIGAGSVQLGDPVLRLDQTG